jgi:hypothetical protein
MKSRSLAIGLGVVVRVVIIAGALWQRSAAAVGSFDECVKKGYPVMESYPRQCRAGDKTFTEQLTSEVIKIRVTTPAPGSVITSPYVVTGEAPGSWFFEASFPLRLVDANGEVVARSFVQAKGEWMTPSFVPFEGTLTFAAPATATGTLVFEKSNASGLPETADELYVPIRFR